VSVIIAIRATLCDSKDVYYIYFVERERDRNSPVSFDHIRESGFSFVMIDIGSCIDSEVNSKTDDGSYHGSLTNPKPLLSCYLFGWFFAEHIPLGFGLLLLIPINQRTRIHLINLDL
jgi:hypothetical protein